MEESCLWAQGRPSFISCVAVAVIREEVCIKYTEKGKYVFHFIFFSTVGIAPFNDDNDLSFSLHKGIGSPVN
jgi:hypothetical protein